MNSFSQNNSTDDPIYLVIEKQNKTDLANIRIWGNLQVGFDGELIWVKGFTLQQIQSVEVKQMLHKKAYYGKLGKLFPIGSLLPVGVEPSLIWSAIDRALPIELPSFNHNFFGLEEKNSLKLIPQENEEQAYALIVSLSDLKDYIQTAPAVRLKPLQWVILGEDKALILGHPILPIKGDAHWRKGNFLLPTGFGFDLRHFMGVLDKKLNDQNKFWLIWNPDNTYFKVNKLLFQPLSIASFRKSFSPNVNVIVSDFSNPNLGN